MLEIALFGVPGDGNCLLSTCDLSFKAQHADWQSGGSKFPNITKRWCPSITERHPLASELERAKTLWAYNPIIQAARALACTSDGGNAFGESTPTSALKKDVFRISQDVGLDRPFTVVLDCGAGTLGILLSHAQFYPDAVYIGFERDQRVDAHGVNINRAMVQESSGKHGRIATRCIKAQLVGSLEGATNVELFDGTCSRLDCLDPEHITLIAMFMETPSVDEFTTTKLSSHAVLLA